MSIQAHIRVKEAPIAPRAMLNGSAGLEENEVTLHKYLNLLHCLDEFQGQGRIDREDKKCGENRYTTKELRRSFLDGVSYLCDIRPNGGTVTAAAIRKFYKKKEIQARLYLAANETIPDEVFGFVVKMLRDLEDMTPDNRGQKEEKILREALLLGQQRVEHYHKKFLYHFKRCHRDISVLFKGKYSVILTKAR